MVWMMSASAALSTSVTKSLRPLLSTWTASRRGMARTMMSPARRAALTAILSRGCIGEGPAEKGRYDTGRAADRHSHRARRTLASREHRGGGARHEKHGVGRAGAGPPEGVSAPGG